MNIKIISDIMNTQKVHGSARESVFEILKNRNPEVGVEIGVQYGLLSEKLLDFHPNLKMYGIDPYNTDLFQVSGDKDKTLDDEIYENTLKTLSKFGDRYKHIRKTSNDALIDVPGLIDFVYIDGDKTKKAVWDDMSYWFPKIREGGVMMGHDYGHPSYRYMKPLIDRYFGFEPKVEEGGIWWVEKRKKEHRKVSVVTPFYNSGFYARELIKHTNDPRIDEMIIVDDCSIPGETEMLTEVIKNNPKIQYYRNSENVGELRSRIRGTELAKNDWIIYLDGDNSLTEKYLDAISMVPTWRDDVIYAPAFGNKRKINYRILTGKYINKENISDLIRSDLYMISMFLNTGNYFMNKNAYLETARKVIDTPKHSYGDIVVNTEWFLDGKYIFVVENMDYVHALRKNSAWKDHAQEMTIKVTECLDKLK